MVKKFIRSDYMRFSKLGKKRKSLQKWRKPKGRDNKIREKRFGYPTSPSVGHKSSKKEYGKIEGKMPVIVRNLKDMKNLDSNNVLILGKIGSKKKIDIIKKAIEMKLKIVNMVEEKKK